MKGKHQRARRRRDSVEVAAVIGRLRVEIEAEATRASSAHRAASHTRAARARLRQEVNRNEQLLASLTHDAGHLAAAVGPAWDAIGAALAELRAMRKKFSTNTTTRGLDELIQAGFKVRLVDVHRSANASYYNAWYRKRTRQRLHSTRAIPLHGWVPPEVPDDRAALAPYATCTVRDDTMQARRAWAVPPWLRPPTDNTDAPILRALLGATSVAATAFGDVPSAGVLRDDATISTPWRHAPNIAEPADATDLTYWYRRSALSQGWRPTTDPVPFWLPAEHSVSYPQARALPNGTPLRLPFPAVFVALASPWQLDPTPAEAGEPAPSAAIRTLMLYARGRAAHGQAETLATVLNRLHAVGSIERADLPTPLQAISHYGGHVEGVILAANRDGEPQDDFAWCIAIGHPTGLPLGRVAVPAFRSRTAWRTQIDNVLAGVALSSWHEPADAALSRGPDARHDGEHHDPDVAVRVLNIDDTSPTGLGNSQERSGQTPRPHLRRGHWRRQPVGHRRATTRWTWVRPTTVGGMSPFTRQVYVLPTRQ